MFGSSPHTRGAHTPPQFAFADDGIIPAYAGSTTRALDWSSPLRDHPRIRGEHSCRSWRRSPPGRIIPAYAGSTRFGRSWRRCRGDHPRIRGEHSTVKLTCASKSGSSPHTRGAPPEGTQNFVRARIIPAYAGSTTSSCGGRARCRDHPRIRGEHARRVLPVVDIGGSSPHTRGAPTPPTRSRSRPADHPRIRGEHVRETAPANGTIGSSPHTRGAPRRSPSKLRSPRIIPAYAGSTTLRPPSRRSMPDHPRIRGEHLGLRTMGRGCFGSSPHTRGALGVGVHLFGGGWIIPAYAGSTGPRERLPTCLRDHPRIRGEHPVCERHQVFRSGSSPHTRGARLWGRRRPGRRRIIPAYAGSTTLRPPSRRSMPDHPRIRGEHLGLRTMGRGCFGSSPHTRGALGVGVHLFGGGWIIPAYAGSTGPRERLPTCLRDHPRIRGEHPVCERHQVFRSGSSPHTRGARLWGRRRPGRRRIIPAYAGSTTSSSASWRLLRDHPRIRGEHSTSPTGLVFASGSSPHTRGAPTFSAMDSPPLGIIPAYAGSTDFSPSTSVAAADHPRIRGEHVDGVGVDE